MNNVSNTLHIKNSLITNASKFIITYRKRNFPCIMFLAIALFLAGCAGTAGRHRALMPMTIKLDEYSNLILSSENVREVNMLDIENQRILTTIANKIRMENRNHFAHINTDINTDINTNNNTNKNSIFYTNINSNKNSDSKMPNTLHATLIFTRYDKGNSFARSMMAGLGQIHIDATLKLTEEDTGEVVGKYEIKKTFAWGGIYGGSVTIEDAEDGFADAVVEAILEKHG